MSTPVETLLAVADIGGRLGIVGEHLRMLLPPDCPPELKANIRAHKSALLELLRLNFLIVRSGTVNSTLFWTPDLATKRSLCDAGASAGIIALTYGDVRPYHLFKQAQRIKLTVAAKQGGAASSIASSNTMRDVSESRTMTRDEAELEEMQAEQAFR